MHYFWNHFEATFASSKTCNLSFQCCCSKCNNQTTTNFNTQPHSYYNILMWATCCLAFFGFLHCNEFTVPAQRSYDPSVHLSYSDIAVDDCDNPSIIVVDIKKSKTDSFRRGTGTSITLGTTQDEIFPVKAI